MDTSQLPATLAALWQQLASNPANRAMVIARLLVNHADDATTRTFAERIAQHTPPALKTKQGTLAPCSCLLSVSYVPVRSLPVGLW